MKIVIASYGKSGSTALFYKIKDSLSGEIKTFFEVSSLKGINLNKCDHVIVKTFYTYPDWDKSSFEQFDKRISLVRDPRDYIVSFFLYMAGFHSNYASDDSKVNDMLRLLRRKEEKNDSVSFLDLLKLNGSLSGNNYLEKMKNQWNRIMQCLPLVDTYFTFKYEYFVLGNMDSLSEYLGFNLSGEARVEDEYKRVVRTKSLGDWKNWFLPEDIEFFYPLFNAFIEKYGYSKSWNLPPLQQVLPRNSSFYFERLIAERRNIKDDPSIFTF